MQRRFCYFWNNLIVYSGLLRGRMIWRVLWDLFVLVLSLCLTYWSSNSSKLNQIDKINLTRKGLKKYGYDEKNVWAENAIAVAFNRDRFQKEFWMGVGWKYFWWICSNLFSFLGSAPNNFVLIFSFLFWNLSLMMFRWDIIIS